MNLTVHIRIIGQKNTTEIYGTQWANQIVEAIGGGGGEGGLGGNIWLKQMGCILIHFTSMTNGPRILSWVKC